MASPPEDIQASPPGQFSFEDDLNETGSAPGSDVEAEVAGADDVSQSEGTKGSKSKGGTGRGIHGKGAKGRGRAQPSPSEADTTVSKKTQNRDLMGMKKANKQYTRKCKGCGLFFKPEAMGSKSAFCLRDKHRLDSLTRVAKAQGKLSWISEERKDEDKVKKVLKKYDELTGGTGILKSQARSAV